MCHLLKLRTYVAAYTLCWRIRVGHFRMTGLKVLQLVHHEVKILVAYRRLVKYVIFVIMLLQILSKLQNPLFLVHY